MGRRGNGGRYNDRDARDESRYDEDEEPYTDERRASDAGYTGEYETGYTDYGRGSDDGYSEEYSVVDRALVPYD